MYPHLALKRLPLFVIMMHIYALGNEAMVVRQFGFSVIVTIILLVIFACSPQQTSKPVITEIPIQQQPAVAVKYIAILATDESACKEKASQMKADYEASGYKVKSIEYFPRGAKNVTGALDKFVIEGNLLLVNIVVPKYDKTDIEKIVNARNYSIELKYTEVAERLKTQLLFTRYVGQDKSNEIYIVNDDGSNLTNLTKVTANDSYPNWSPDKSKILFTSNRNRSWLNEYDIFTMSPDGSDLTLLSKVGISGPSFQYPVWSNDGSKIAFCKSRTSLGQYYRFSVHTMNPDGSMMNQITPAQDASSEATEYFPKYFDNSRRIAYIFYKGFYSIESIRVETLTGDTTTILSQVAYPSLSGNKYMPHFDISPDGKLIAYSVYVDNTRTIYIVDIASGDIKASTKKTWYADFPCWSPDGNSIAFEAGDGIYTMPVDCSRWARIAGTGGDDTPYSWK
jgi:hypothetical protein